MIKRETIMNDLIKENVGDIAECGTRIFFVAIDDEDNVWSRALKEATIQKTIDQTNRKLFLAVGTKDGKWIINKNI
jgi:hypothetical protein